MFLFIYGMRLRKKWAASIGLVNGSGAARVKDQPIPVGTILRNQSVITYDGAATQVRGDYLLVVPARTTSRVDKKIINHADPVNSPLAVGSVVEYELQPRYSTTFPPQPANFTITDVLPPGLEYVAGSALVGANQIEPVIEQNQPAAGYTRLKWTLADIEPHLGDNDAAANTAAIKFKARIGLTVANGTSLVNHVAVSGGPLDYDADCTFEVSGSGYGACKKSARAELKVQTNAGFRIEKATLTAAIEPGQQFKYRLGYAALGADINAPDIPELIDILPYVGDGTADPARNFVARTPASTFDSGAYKLSAVSPPGNDPGMQVYYTKAAHNTINNDPRDASNAMSGGTTKWCAASDFGTAGCPANIGEVTAIRFKPGVSVMPANQSYAIELTFDTAAAVAKPGDQFSNAVGARPVSNASSLLYVNAPSGQPVEIKAGGASVAGRVYIDSNDDGNDAGETGIASNTIVLHACVAGANGTVDTPQSNMGTTPPSCQGDDQYITRTVDTGANGEYKFTGLLTGIYTLVQPNQPAGYQDGTTTTGLQGGTVTPKGTTPSKIAGFELASGSSPTVATGYNFGELLTLHSLSGKVYWKQTIAGVEQAGDYPIANNEVKLVGCAAGPDGVVNTTEAASGALMCSGDDVAHEQPVQTNGSGEYSFANIPRGRYHVNQTSDGALKPYLNGVTTVGTGAGGTATDEATVPSQIRNVLFDSATSIAATGYNFGERANIEAKNDNLGEVTAGVESTTTKSVVNDDNDSGRDQANGVNAVAGGSAPNVTVTPDTTNAAGVSVPAGFTLNTDGTITVASTVSAGTHKYPYTICLTPATTPATCHSAVATIVVKAMHSLSGRVYWDKDGSGDLDPANDEYIRSTVTLFRCEAGPDGTIESIDARSCVATDVLRQAWSITVSPTDGLFQFTNLPTGIYRLEQEPTWIEYEYKNGVTTPGTVAGAVNGVAESTPGTEPQKSVIKQIRLEGATSQAGIDYLFGEVKIVADDDDYTANPLLTTGGNTPATDPVTKNDLANGSSVDLNSSTGNATITGIGVVGGNPATGGLELNPNGTIKVHPNTPVGTYQYEYKLCLKAPYDKVCTTAKATVKVEAPAMNSSLSGKVYFDKNDDGQPQAGEPGIQDNKLVLYGCVAGPNGTLETKEINVPSSPDWCIGDDVLVELETMTGSDGGYVFSSLENGLYTVVQPGQPAGYSNGKTSAGNAGGVASEVTDLPSYIKNIALSNGAEAKYNNFGELLATIEAYGNDLGHYNTATGGTTASVLANNGSGTDKANGADATLTNVTLTQVSSSNARVTLNTTTGLIEVAVGAPVGTHTVEYEICLVSHPTICAKATETVHVVSIDAVDDNMGEHNYSATNPIVTPSVLENNGNGGDTANGQPAVIGTNVTLELGTPSSPALTMDPATGIITVAPGTAPGTYTFPYTICLLPATNPATCDTATATVVVKDAADVRLSKTVDKTDASVGDEVTFTITVVNDGPSTAEAVTVTEQLPSGYSFVSAMASEGT
ncbi:hypothetical protein CO615_05960, partial [Lysobacteraceae bacterium NML75-0749]